MSRAVANKRRQLYYDSFKIGKIIDVKEKEDILDVVKELNDITPKRDVIAIIDSNFRNTKILQRHDSLHRGARF